MGSILCFSQNVEISRATSLKLQNKPKWVFLRIFSLCVWLLRILKAFESFSLFFTILLALERSS